MGSSGMPTPWGPAQRVIRHTPGIIAVSTAGHGGLMIGRAIAQKRLSEAGRKHGFAFSTWLCFEEDCAIAIPLLELPELWPAFFPVGSPGAADPRAYLVGRLSRWAVPYLRAVGIEPEREGLLAWLFQEEDDRLRREQPHDLIVTAWGPQRLGSPDVVRVATADGVQHVVTAASYNQLKERVRTRTGHRCLSACVIVHES